MNGIVKCRAANVSTANVKVTLFNAGSGKSVKVVETTADSTGAFSFPEIAPDVTAPEPFFIVSTMPTNELIMTAILGSTFPATYYINEVTTVAAAYSAAQFITAGLVIEASPFALSIVAAMNANLVDVTTGLPSSVMTTSPNADETSSCRTLMSLANVVASWFNDPSQLDAMLPELAPMPNGSQPDDTIEALVSIARNPHTFAEGIYKQSLVLPVYQSALEEPLEAWTLVVKVNDSGDDANMFGGPGSVVFDKQGRAWISNNVQQGTGISSAYGFVLDMSGRPATDANGKRISPFTGGGLYGAGFGIDVDSSGNVWIGDFGWGGEKYWPAGGVSAFDADANAISPAPDAYTMGPVLRVQGTLIDGSDNVWCASYGNGNVVVYRAGIPPTSFAVYEGGSSVKPFAIAIAADGSAWVTNSATENSGIIHLQLNGTGTLASSPQINVGRTIKGIVIDGSGNIWVASGGDSYIYVFDSSGNPLGKFNGGGIDGPWGIALDGNDDLWVGNFGPLRPGSVFHGRLSKLAGVNATGHQLGDPLTPETGYKLRTARSQVLLHDLTPLYGPDGPECFIPMMRTTAVNIDAAGNVWTCNNWKPDFDTDAIGGAAGNPGGDGMLIWVGLATPRPR